MLGIVVAKERPDLEEQKSQLVEASASGVPTNQQWAVGKRLQKKKKQKQKKLIIHIYI